MYLIMGSWEISPSAVDAGKLAQVHADLIQLNLLNSKKVDKHFV